MKNMPYLKTQFRLDQVNEELWGEKWRKIQESQRLCFNNSSNKTGGFGSLLVHFEIWREPSLVRNEPLRIKALYVCSAVIYFFLFVSPGLVRVCFGVFFQFKFRPKGQICD